MMMVKELQRTEDGKEVKGQEALVPMTWL